MTCNIYVEFKKNVVNKTSIHEYILDDEIYISRGNGIIMKIKDEYYIFTCNHIIEKNPIIIKCYTDEHEINTIIFKRIYEYDVCILKINYHDYVNIKKYYTNENVGIINSFLECGNYISHNLEKSCEIVKNICVKNSHIKSVIVPMVPMYEFEICGEVEDYNGMSGSILMNDTNIIGMVLCKSNKILMAIPIVLILNFMTNELKYIKFNYDIVDFTLEKKYNGLYINDIINKKYNSTINVGDVIVSCENQEINDVGEIYCDELKLYITIDTFIMLHNKNYIDIQILNINETFENIICYKYDIEHICKIFIQKQNKIFNINGLIFTELSEELIIENVKNGMNYYKEIYNSLFDNSEKYIVMILNTSSNKKYNKFIHKPLLKLEESKYLKSDKIIPLSYLQTKLYVKK
jgi:hypothetical protein